MTKYFAMGILGIALMFSLGLTGCPMDGDDPSGGPEQPSEGKDPLGLASVTINGVTVDIGFKGTVGFGGSEGWGFNNGGAQNGGIYSAASEADLANVTVVAVPQDSGATVAYAVSHYSANPPAQAADPEFSTPETFSPSGVLGQLYDLDFIAVEVTKGETKAWYKFRVAVDAPILGADGISAGGTKLGWTIPDLQWTHNQGAYFHNNVGPNPEQSIGLIIQDTLPLNGKTLTADAPGGATVTWAIGTAGDNNTGVTLPAQWNNIGTALPSPIASGSLLTVRVVKGTKTLYYNWWVYSKTDVKLSALSIAGNIIDAAKLISFADSWSGAALQEVVIPVDGDILEGAKITWTEPLGMGLAVAVTDGTTPAEDDWLGTSRGQNESYAIVVQPPAVDLESNNVLSIRARISDKVWYYKVKITFRGLQATDADLTGLTVANIPVTNFGTAAATVQAANAGQALNLTLAQATNAVIAPAGGPNAEFLFIKGNGTATPGNTAGWVNSGTLSFDTGDYLVIQAFAGELDSKYYKFLVTVTYPNADDVRLASLSIGGTPLTTDGDVKGGLGTPWVEDGAVGAKGSLVLPPSMMTATVQGAAPEGVEGLLIQYALYTGAELTAEDWKESIYNPGNPMWGVQPSWTHPEFTFAKDNELWIKVAAGTRTVKTYKLVVDVGDWLEADAVLSSLLIGGDFDFNSFSYGYSVTVGGVTGTPGNSLGTPANSLLGVTAAGALRLNKAKVESPTNAAGLYLTGTTITGAPVQYAKITGGATPTAWDDAFGPDTGFGRPPLAYVFANGDTLWIRVNAGQFVAYYKLNVEVYEITAATSTLSALNLGGTVDYLSGAITGGVKVDIPARASDTVTGTITLDAATAAGTVAWGATESTVSTNVTLVAPADASYVIAKTTGPAPAEDAWDGGSDVEYGGVSYHIPPVFAPIANGEVLWIKITAGTFTTTYKFTVTVTPAGA
jgi:hypothetical protein